MYLGLLFALLPWQHTPLFTVFQGACILPQCTAAAEEAGAEQTELQPAVLAANAYTILNRVTP